MVREPAAKLRRIGPLADDHCGRAARSIFSWQLHKKTVVSLMLRRVVPMHEMHVPAIFESVMERVLRG